MDQRQPGSIDMKYNLFIQQSELYDEGCIRTSGTNTFQQDASTNSVDLEVKDWIVRAVLREKQRPQVADQQKHSDARRQ